MAIVTLAAAVIVVAASIACGAPATPDSVSSVQPSVATGVSAPDAAAVTEGIIRELRTLGVDAVVAERFGGEPFSVGTQRVAIPSVADNNIYLYVYRTSALAANEAFRITPTGQVESADGPPRVSVLWVGTQHFYYRDRVIARHGGCDRRVIDAMRTLFGPPLVVTGSTC